MVHNSYGYPRLKWIRSRIRARGIDSNYVTLSAGYEYGENCGILWSRRDAKIALQDLHVDFEEYGWKVKASKYHGRIHSIWIQKIETTK